MTYIDDVFQLASTPSYRCELKSVAKVSRARAGVAAFINVQCNDAGHAKASVSGQRIVARHTEAILDAQISIDPGRRLKIRAQRRVDCFQDGFTAGVSRSNSSSAWRR